MRKIGQKLVNSGAFCALSFLLCAAPGHAFALADSDLSITTETEVYEWVEEDVGEDAGIYSAAQKPALDRYGPFRVISPVRAELTGSIETNTPAQFRALLAAYPGMRHIDMIDCPGTGDDTANFAIARMIRSNNIATHVPDGGFVASGAVELFLAGKSRSAAPTAEFAVHSWRDSDGGEAGDYADSDPVHREYIRFYREIGMDDAKARAFYAMTNSVGHDDALYLKPSDIARYVALN